jgi:hypothetical protein
MNIVYVIASSGRDDYTAMARVSLASLRMSNPGARATVVCDAQTDRAVRSVQDPILDEVDDWRAFETPPGDGSFRSKFLKSSLRQRLSGPYLFLDVDTIVRDDLTPISRVDGDIAGAPNHSREELSRQIWEGDRAILSAMQWTTRDTFYVNSGVLWASESAGARRIYGLWHEKWLEQQLHLHDSRDQPSLNTAICESNIRCFRLDCRCNAQIGAHPLSMRNAMIWHYYYSLDYQSNSNFGDLIQKTIQTQQVDIRRLHELMETQMLWPGAYWTSGSGKHMVNGAVRDLIHAAEAGGDSDALFLSMRRTDPVFARYVLAKAMVDSYWGDKPTAYRLFKRRLIRRYPGKLFSLPVAHCLRHELYQRLKRIPLSPWA